MVSLACATIMSMFVAVAARPQGAPTNAEGDSPDKAQLARNLAQFFKSLDSSQQETLKGIFQDQALTKGDIKQKIQQFIQTLPADKQVSTTNLEKC